MFVSVLHYMCDGQIAQVYLSLVSLVICLVFPYLGVLY